MASWMEGWSMSKAKTRPICSSFHLRRSPPLPQAMSRRVMFFGSRLVRVMASLRRVFLTKLQYLR